MKYDWHKQFFIILGAIAAIILVAYLIGSARSEEPIDINPTSEVDIDTSGLAFVRCSKTSSNCINFIFPNLTHCQIGLTDDQFCLAVNDAD